MDDSGAFEAWAAEAIAKRWPRTRIAEIAALRGDLSTRRFWRVAIATRPETAAPPTAILVDLGPDDLPRYVRVLNLLPTPIAEPPWVNVHRFLESIGAPVPALYDADPARRAMLVEDVGETSLFQAALNRRPSTGFCLPLTVVMVSIVPLFLVSPAADSLLVSMNRLSRPPVSVSASSEG